MVVKLTQGRIVTKGVTSLTKHHVIEFLIAQDGQITPNFSDSAFSVLVVCRCGTEPILFENIPFIIIIIIITSSSLFVSLET